MLNSGDAATAALQPLRAVRGSLAQSPTALTLLQAEDGDPILERWQDGGAAVTMIG